MSSKMASIISSVVDSNNLNSCLEGGDLFDKENSLSEIKYNVSFWASTCEHDILSNSSYIKEKFPKELINLNSILEAINNLKSKEINSKNLKNLELDIEKIEKIYNEIVGSVKVGVNCSLTGLKQKVRGALTILPEKHRNRHTKWLDAIAVLYKEGIHNEGISGRFKGSIDTAKTLSELVKLDLGISNISNKIDSYSIKVNSSLKKVDLSGKKLKNICDKYKLGKKYGPDALLMAAYQSSVKRSPNNQKNSGDVRRTLLEYSFDQLDNAVSQRSFKLTESSLSVQEIKQLIVEFNKRTFHELDYESAFKSGLLHKNKRLPSEYLPAWQSEMQLFIESHGLGETFPDIWNALCQTDEEVQRINITEKCGVIPGKCVFILKELLGQGARKKVFSGDMIFFSGEKKDRPLYLKNLAFLRANNEDLQKDIDIVSKVGTSPYIQSCPTIILPKLAITTRYDGHLESKRENASFQEILTYILHAAKGFQALKDVNLVYGDFNLGGILCLGSNAVVSDFGSAEPPSDVFPCVVSRLFASPEDRLMIRKDGDSKPFSFKCTSWSLGVALVYMLLGKEDFYRGKPLVWGKRGLRDIITNMNLYSSLLSLAQDIEKLLTSDLDPLDHVSDEFKQLIRDCLNVDATKRPTIEEIIAALEGLPEMNANT